MVLIADGMDQDNRPRHPVIFLLSLMWLGAVFTVTWANIPTSFDSITAEGWSAVAAFLSLVVAIMAVFISVYQVQETNRAARLSVKPHCFFISVIPNMEMEPVGLSLRNNGLGPAMMVEWTFTVDGVKLPQKDVEGFKAIIARYRLAGICQMMLLTFPSSLAADKTERILYIPTQNCLQEVLYNGRVITANSVMDHLMKEVNFHLTYKDAYDEKYTISSLD